MIPNNGARTSALLAGDVDFIEAVPTTDVATLKKNPKIHLSEATSLRFVYLMFNRSHQDAPPGVSGPNGEKLDKNPYNDLRVRRALSMAINRDAIVSRVMEGLAIPTGQFLAPGSVTYTPDLKPMKYDPAQAKKLLAEAGFPHGLRVTLTGPNDRYVNDGKIIQAVGQMWSRIGVQTTVDAMTWPSYIGRASKQEFSAFLVAWGISSGEASNPLRALIHTYDASRGLGSVNRGRYSNPKLDAMIDAAMKIGDDKKREAALQDATRVAMNDVALLPLHIQKNVWGMKAGLTYIARADEATQAMGVLPTKK
jgi:peptide/nickel transport system substrate-binding protein